MDAFIKKMRHKPKPNPWDDREGEVTVDPAEQALADEDSVLSPGFAGKLSFAGGYGDSSKDSEPKDSEASSTYQVLYEGSQTSSSRVTFEVTSAEVIKDTSPSPVKSVLPGHSSHVDYTITVTSSTGVSAVPTRVVRRYSDFELLHKTLKKKFPSAVSTIVFPHKVFMGNFSRETIAKRSRAFEQCLTHIYSILELRYCAPFLSFFAGDSYGEAAQAFLAGNYLQTLACLEQYLPVVEKLYGNSHHTLSCAVCMLVVSHAKTNRVDVADRYATLAMAGLPECLLTLPLLQKLARLRWSLGRDKMDVEERLQGLRAAGVNVESALDLEEALCQQLRSGSL